MAQAPEVPAPHLPQLFADFTRDVSALVSKEVQLARAEIGEKIGQLGKGLLGAVAGGVLLLAALFFVLQAVAEALTPSLGEAGAPLAVGLVVGVIGAAALAAGLNAAKLNKLNLTRTAHQVQEDVRAAREQVQ